MDVCPTPCWPKTVYVDASKVDLETQLVESTSRFHMPFKNQLFKQLQQMFGHASWISQIGFSLTILDLGHDSVVWYQRNHHGVMVSAMTSG